MNKYKGAVKGLVIACSFLMILSFMKVDALAFIQKSGTMVEDASLYKSASDTSTVVMELEKDTEVLVNNKEDDSSGRIWYELCVNGDTYGYVKAELVLTSATSTSSKEDPVEDKKEDSKPEDVQTTVSYETYTQLVGTITPDSVNVRKEASTTTDVITSLSSGTKFDIISETTGADNYVWYQTQLEVEGQTVQGYIRSDLATTAEEERQREIIEEVKPEEVTPQEPEVVAPYTIVQGTDEDGEIIWFLQDEAKEQYEITGLIASEGKSGVGIGIILLIIFLILLLGAVGFLAYTYYSRLVDAEDYLYELKEKKEQNKKASQKKAQELEKKPMVHLSQPELQTPKGESPLGKTVTVKSTKSVPAKQNQAKAKPAVPPARPGNKPPVRQTPKAKPASFVEPGMKTKIDVQSPKETYKNTTIKTPEYNYLPKSEDIMETTSRDLESRFQTEKVKTEKKSWKSKNFLTDDDDDLDFNFLTFDDDK